MAQIAATWEEENDDQTIVQLTRQSFDDMDLESPKRGVYHPYKYINYEWEAQRVTEGRGVKNIAIMREVSRTYDPHLIFQQADPGGFRIPQ